MRGMGPEKRPELERPTPQSKKVEAPSRAPRGAAGAGNAARAEALAEGRAEHEPFAGNAARAASIAPPPPAAPRNSPTGQAPAPPSLGPTPTAAAQPGQNAPRAAGAEGPKTSGPKSSKKPALKGPSGAAGAEGPKTSGPKSSKEPAVKGTPGAGTEGAKEAAKKPAVAGGPEGAKIREAAKAKEELAKAKEDLAKVGPADDQAEADREEAKAERQDAKQLAERVDPADAAAEAEQAKRQAEEARQEVQQARKDEAEVDKVAEKAGKDLEDATREVQDTIDSALEARTERGVGGGGGPALDSATTRQQEGSVDPSSWFTGSFKTLEAASKNLEGNAEYLMRKDPSSPLAQMTQALRDGPFGQGLRFGTGITGMVDKAWNLPENAGKAWEGLKQGDIGKAAGGAADVLGLWKDGSDAFKEAYQMLPGGLQGNIKDFQIKQLPGLPGFDKVVGLAANSTSAFANFHKAITGAITGEYDGEKRTFEQWTRDAVAGVSDAKEVAKSDTAKALGKKVAESKFGQWVGEKAATLGEKAAGYRQGAIDKGKTFLKNGKAFLGNARAAAKSMLSKAGRTMVQGATQMAQKGWSTAKMVKTALMNGGKTVANGAARVAGKVGAGLNTAVTAVGSTAKALGKKVAETRLGKKVAESKVGQWVGEKAAMLGGKVANFKNGAVSKGKAFLDKGKAILGKTRAAAKSVLGKAGRTMVRGAAKMAQKAGASTAKVVTTALKAGKVAGKAVAKTAARVAGKVASRFVPGLNAAVAVADSAAAVRDIAAAAKGEGSVGKAAVSGIRAVGSIAAATNIPVVSQIGAGVSALADFAMGWWD